MRASLIIPRLRVQVPAFGNRVAGTADFAKARETTADLATPHAFVIALDEQPTENENASNVIQSVIEEIGVIVAADNSNDERGQTADESMHGLKDAILAALLGFEPADEYGPLEYTGALFLGIDRARLWRQFTFAAERFISS